MNKKQLTHLEKRFRRRHAHFFRVHTQMFMIDSFYEL